MGKKQESNEQEEEKEDLSALLGADFDWSSYEESAVSALRSGEKLGGKDGVLAPLTK